MPALIKRSGHHIAGVTICQVLAESGRYLIESSGEPSEVVMNPLLGRSSSSQIWYQQVEDNGISKQAGGKLGFNYTSLLPARVCMFACARAWVCGGLTFIHALFFFNLQQKNLAETAEGAPSLLFCFLWGTSFQKCLPFLEDRAEIDTTGYTGMVSMYLRMLFSFRLRLV